MADEKFKLLATPLKIMVMGAQGSGKSTQAGLLSQNLGLPTIFTGQICRERVTVGDELGKKIKGFLDKGIPVADDIMLKIIKEKVSEPEMKNGFIGEGFPRTLVQVEAIKGLFSVVFYLKLSDEVSKRRLMARRICEKCDINYNLLTKPPKKEGVCDICGGKLISREDDTEELITARLNSYHLQTEPVLDHYRVQGILEEIDGEKSIEEIQKEIIERLILKGLINA